MKLEKYLESQERELWDKFSLLTHVKGLLSDCKTDRKEWDKQARWGRRVQKFDFSFMDKHFGDKKPTTEVWGVNFIADNIAYSIASAVASDIKISLYSDNGEISKAQMLLEAKLNFSIDKFKVLRKSDQVLWDCEYTGMAYGRMGWNPMDQDGMWFNGKPDYRVIQSEDLWLDPAIKAKDKSDKRFLFYREQFVTKNLRRISPVLSKLVDDHYTNIEDETGVKSDRLGIISAYHYLYKRTFRITRRAIVNEESPKVKWVFEKEWEDTIKEITKQPELSPDEFDRYKQMGELLEETAILPEGLRTSLPIDSELDYWFEALFIPELDIVINYPKNIGTKCPVAIKAGNYSSHSAYSFSNAWKMKTPLELSILNMTIQFFDTVKKHKPIISIMPGAIINEKTVRENWGSPNLIIRWNLQFFKDNPELKPRDCLYAVQFPNSGQMQLLLDEKLQRAADQSQVTPAVTKGEQPYAGMPAEGIARLQQAAATGSKNSYIEYSEYILQLCEVLKDLLIEYVNYKHKILTVLETGERGMEDINSESDNMLSNAEDSIVTVVLEENSEISKSIKEQKLMLAYKTLDEMGKPLIMSSDLLRGILPDDAERLLNAKEAFLSAHPQLLQQALGNTGLGQQVETA